MATPNLSSALPTPPAPTPCPKASPGYGKRSVPDQRPPRADDFALLPERERYIAGYVDQLPEGAAMNIKSLAKQQPLYGQMAVGSALRALGVAGHLRQARCAVGDGDSLRWVTRTFWSRTARDNEWWNTFLTAEATHSLPQPVIASPTPPPPWVPAEPAAPAEPAPVPVVPQQRTAPEKESPAYLALTRLGPADTRLGLSEDDCRDLEELAAEWFAHGADADYLVHTLTAGLPPAVDSPLGFVRKRLITKLPPQRPTAPLPAPPGTSTPRLMVECTDCGAPGRAEAFRDGLCGPCREPAQSPDADPASAEGPGIERDIQAHVTRLREQLKLR